MNATYISIEKNIKTFEFYKQLWGSRGIIGVRADTMTKGIEMAIAVEKSKTQYLYFVDIVADNIDYMPELSELYERINAPILIAASVYNVDEHHKALNNGAYFYGQYNGEAEKNVNVVITVANRYHHKKEQRTETNILTNGGISVFISQRQAFVNDTQIKLTKIEYDLLCYFMSNIGSALSYGQIFLNVWNDKYNETSNEAIKGIIKRLRKKLANDENENCIIENIHSFGFKMPLINHAIS
jgi:DNA-binding response OmpR family regulator